MALWLAHVCADLLIFAILAGIMFGKVHLSEAASR
jgi:hypothetical protein